MHLYVKPPHGKVTVSAPLSVSDEVIERFLHAKTDWIKEKIAKFGSRPQVRQPEWGYLSGETLHVWGGQHYIKIEYGNKNFLVLLGDTAVFTVRKESTTEQREKFVREWYRELLKAEIARQLPKWEKITGLKATSWQTKHMTTRWGTCNTKTGKIWLNLQLAKEPPKCLEYVILHELIHLTEKSHSKRFVLLMDKYMPMWREVKAALNGRTH